MNNTLKVTFIDKESGECFTKPDYYLDFEEHLTSYNVNTDNENIKEYADNEESNNENCHNNVFETQDCGLDKNIIKDELHACTSIKKNYNSNETTNPLKQKNTSFINEYDLFLKTYKVNCNNYITSNTSMSNETEKLMHDVVKPQYLRQMLDSTDVCENSETGVLPQMIESDDDKNTYREDIPKIKDLDNRVTSVAHISEPFDLLNTEIQLNYDKELKQFNNSYEFPVVLNDVKDVIVKENDNIVLLSSGNSRLSIDSIHIDPSANYSLSNRKTDSSINNEFEANSDGAGYNSSDFEFIDEEEARLGGILNKCCSKIKFETLNHDNKTIEDCENISEVGTSQLTFNTPKYNKDLITLHSRRNSDTGIEALDNNHVIPEGEDLYQLFAEPWTAYNYQAENKAFFSTRAMHLEVDNFAFNVGLLHQRHQENDVNDALKQEATENARRILVMYPMENTKQRRRFEGV